MKDYSTQNAVEINKKSYNKIAKEFSATRSYVWKDVDLLMKGVRKGDKVLDVGCGNGRLLKVLKDKGIEYLGIDNSEKLIEQARKKYPGYQFEVEDVLDNEVGSMNNEFDLVFAISVLNHFPKEQQDRVVQNIYKALKPGGYLLIINWNLWNVHNKKSVWRARAWRDRDVVTQWKSNELKVPLYYYAFTKGELKRLLKRNGFKIVKNFYSKKGKKSSWLFGENIVTIAKNQ